MMSKLPPELDTVILACCRGGRAPAGTWDALAALTGLGKHQIRHRSQQLKAGAPKAKAYLVEVPPPPPAPARRQWWPFWRRH